MWYVWVLLALAVSASVSALVISLMNRKSDSDAVVIDSQPKNNEEFPSQKDSTCDLVDYIPDCYYINLEKRTDRLFYVVPTLKSLGYPDAHRIDAVLDSPGYRGCTQSHLKCFKHIMERTEDPMDKWYFIAEDDIVRTGFSLPEGWSEILRDESVNIVFLAANVQEWGTEGKHGCKQINDSYSSSAYLVKRSYIPQLAQTFQRSLEKEVPLDVEWKNLQRDGTWYAVQPLMIKQGASYSDIEQCDVDYGV